MHRPGVYYSIHPYNFEMECSLLSTSTDYFNLVFGIVTAKCVLWRQLTAQNWLRPLSLGSWKIEIVIEKKRLEREYETVGVEQKRERKREIEKEIEKRCLKSQRVDENVNTRSGNITWRREKINSKNSSSVCRCKDKEDPMPEVRVK